MSKPEKHVTTLTPEQIALARRFRGGNMPWMAIGRWFHVAPETVKAALDPDFAERRRQQINEARRKRPKDERRKLRKARLNCVMVKKKRKIPYSGAEKPGRRAAFDFRRAERMLMEARVWRDDGALPPVDCSVFDDTADRAIPADQRKTLLELASHHCRFPVGDPGSPDFFFCGAPAKDGSCYCSAHHARCNVRAR